MLSQHSGSSHEQTLPRKIGLQIPSWRIHLKHGQTRQRIHHYRFIISSLFALWFTMCFFRNLISFNQFYHIFTPSLGLATWWCLSRHLAHLTPWWRAILCVDVSTAQTLPRRKWQRARLRWNVVAMLHERSNVLHSISWCASGFSPSPIQSPVSGYKLG